MDAASGQSWFLRKHQDGSVFGPISFDQLSGWASAAQVAPHDVVSTDQQTWLKAPMVPQLGMDWLVEVTSEHYYGPTTVGAIQEFIRLGDINADTFVIFLRRNAPPGPRNARSFQNECGRLESEISRSCDRARRSRYFDAASGADSRSRTNLARRTPRLRRVGREIQRASAAKSAAPLNRHLFVRRRHGRFFQT